MSSNITLCIGSSFRAINDWECLISRLIGSTIILVGMFSMTFSIRFIYWSFYHRHDRSQHYPLILSMIFSSMSIIIVITPSVLMQCLFCYRLCSPIYCRLEGFVSYSNGCTHMFMLMMISIARYWTVFQTKNRKSFINQYSYLTVALCWIFGLIFAFPPLFNLNKYMPEGIGFHCGLNWFDRTLKSRLYFLFTFSFVYFIPLVVLFTVNIYIYCVIRRLLNGEITRTRSTTSNKKHSSNLSTSSSLDGSNSVTYSARQGVISSLYLINTSTRLVSRRTITTDPLQMYHLIRLNRLHADRRFALATMFLVSEYLLSWTPYAMVALLYLFHSTLIDQQSIIMTGCAFLAKISMILNPFIYIATIKPNQLRVILFCTKCSCSYCRIKRNIVSL